MAKKNEDIRKALNNLVVYEPKETPEIAEEIRKLEEEYAKELEKAYAERDRKATEALKRLTQNMYFKAA